MDIKEKERGAGETAERLIRDIKAVAAEAERLLGSVAKESLARAKGAATENARKIDEGVHEKAWWAVGAAAAAGVAAGWLIGRGKRRRSE